jgi:hypothetical protein
MSRPTDRPKPQGKKTVTTTTRPTKEKKGMADRKVVRLGTKSIL